MSRIDVQRLKDYLQSQLQGTPIVDRLEGMIGEGASKAGTRPEEVFTREFLCPLLRDFFCIHVRPELNLSDEEMSSGLGTEGYENCHGFGFTPARRGKHLFTKSDIIKTSPPIAWRRADRNPLPNYQACPDFAIRRPLPLSIVGEVKYFKSGSPERAIREIYNASRQAVFYLGAFHDIYNSALIVVADASRGHSFFKGLQLLKAELLERFGSETGVHLLPIRLV